MGQIHEVLSRMPRLRHLELDIEDPMDVVDGKKWQSWIPHLNLDIKGSMDIIDGNIWFHISKHSILSL
jgi:hypothetical protein